MGTLVWVGVMSFAPPIAFLFVRDRTPLKRFGEKGEWVSFFAAWVILFIVLRLVTR